MQFGSNNFSQCLFGFFFFWPAKADYVIQLVNVAVVVAVTVVVVDIVVGVLRWLLIFVAAVVAVFPLPQLPFSSCRWCWEWGMGITSASPGMWKCCCNFCCCCLCCCCILLCLVYCTNARFGSGLHSQWGDSFCLAYTLNEGTACVSNPLACNLSVSSSIRIGVCAELPLSLSGFFCGSHFAMWFIKNSSKSAPASARLCACLLGRLPSINRRHQSKRIESQAFSVSVSVSGLSPRLLHSVICFAV